MSIALRIRPESCRPRARHDVLVGVLKWGGHLLSNETASAQICERHDLGLPYSILDETLGMMPSKPLSKSAPEGSAPSSSGSRGMQDQPRCRANLIEFREYLKASGKAVDHDASALRAVSPDILFARGCKVITHLRQEADGRPASKEIESYRKTWLQHSSNNWPLSHGDNIFYCVRIEKDYFVVAVKRDQELKLLKGLTSNSILTFSEGKDHILIFNQSRSINEPLYLLDIDRGSEDDPTGSLTSLNDATPSDIEPPVTDGLLRSRLDEIDHFTKTNPGMPVSDLVKTLIDELKIRGIIATHPALPEIELPKEAPKKWRGEAAEGKSPPDFVREVYHEFLGKGLGQHHLRTLDNALYMAIYHWRRNSKNRWPEDIDLPNYKEAKVRRAHQVAATLLPEALQASPNQVEARSQIRHTLRVLDEEARATRAKKAVG